MSRLRVVAEGLPSSTAKILSFARLPDGWNYGEGRGATEHAVAAAIELNSLLVRYTHETEMFPGVDGGILVCGYNEQQVLEVRCNPAGDMDMWLEVADELAHEQEGVSLDTVNDFLGDLGWQTKNSSGYSIRCITTRKESGIPANPSEEHPRMEESLFLTLNAQSSTVGVSANTPPDITKTFMENLTFSGDSTRAFCQRIAGWFPSHHPVEIRATEIFATLPTGKVAIWSKT